MSAITNDAPRTVARTTTKRVPTAKSTATAPRLKVSASRPDPIAHLTAEDIETLGRELDSVREQVVASRGASDAKYIRTLIKNQRILEIGSRAVLLASVFPPAWVIGTTGLTIAKILDNMEIGHNILHGQWDWMRDPKIHSSSWDWDMASPAATWKHSHNELHHTWTNVIGKDNDVGYGVLRMDEDQRWSPFFIGQPLYCAILAIGFEYFIAAQDLEVGRYVKGRKDKEQFYTELKMVGAKIRSQMLKDYVAHPLLSGPSAVSTLTANLTANLLRNLWTHSVIFCGHFPEGVQTFAKDSIEGETKGEWYLRQMLGSANISGGPLLHLMTGNLSFQIEHHLFPDLPSNRYSEIAPKIQELFARYELPYVTGPLHRQVGSAWKKVFRLAAPNQFWGKVRDALPV